MNQANRKPRSFDELRQANLIAKPMLDLGDGLMVQEGTVDLVNPTDEQLFRLAGGTADMLVTGTAGKELRSILAQRAIHIKEKLYAKAVEKGLAKPKKTTFFERELQPMFGEYHGSSSDSEAGEENHRKAKEAIRAKRRADRMQKKSIVQKIDSYNHRWTLSSILSAFNFGSDQLFEEAKSTNFPHV